MYLTYISGDGTMQLRMGNNYLAPASATPWHEREVGRIQLAGRSHHDNVQGYRSSGQLPAPNLALGGTLFSQATYNYHLPHVDDSPPATRNPPHRTETSVVVSQLLSHAKHFSRYAPDMS